MKDRGATFENSALAPVGTEVERPRRVSEHYLQIARGNNILLCIFSFYYIISCWCYNIFFFLYIKEGGKILPQSYHMHMDSFSQKPQCPGHSEMEG